MHLFTFTSAYHFNLCVKKGYICTCKWAARGSQAAVLHEAAGTETKEGSNSTGIRTESWSCQISQCHSPGVSSAFLHCPFSLPGQHCQLQAPGLAFSRVHATLLAQHSRVVLLLTSQADAPEPAKNSCRLTSPLLSPLTPTIFCSNIHLQIFT